MNLNIPMRPLLSGQEIRVIEETLSGFSPQQIAERLRVRPKTVYTYRFRAFIKLGVGSDAELFQWYGHSLCAKHGDTVPAEAILKPGIRHLMEAA